jgi:hypothetical protein
VLGLGRSCAFLSHDLSLRSASGPVLARRRRFLLWVYVHADAHLSP